jgi:hypothetical protein
MDVLVAWSIGSLGATGAAVLIWMSWVVWHRRRGEHVDWW